MSICFSGPAPEFVTRAAHRAATIATSPARTTRSPASPKKVASPSVTMRISS